MIFHVHFWNLIGDIRLFLIVFQCAIKLSVLWLRLESKCTFPNFVLFGLPMLFNTNLFMDWFFLLCILSSLRWFDGIIANFVGSYVLQITRLILNRGQICRNILDGYSTAEFWKFSRKVRRISTLVNIKLNISSFF